MANKLTIFPNEPNKEPDKQFDQIQIALLGINSWANRLTNDVNDLIENGGVVGPQGATGPAGATGPSGAQGPAGVVSGTYPILYNSGTQTISIDPSGLSGYYLPISGGTMQGSILTNTSGSNNIGASGVPFNNIWANSGHFANIYGFSPITIHDNANFSKTTPEIKLTDTNYSRILRSGSTNLLDIYNQVSVLPTAGTGGTYTTYVSGGVTYAVHTFSSGTATFTPSAPTSVSYLVLAGGGGGGGAGFGGGGGGGGVLTGTTTISSGVSITVGEGGATATNGSNSSISGIATAIGGGRGGNYSSNNASVGGAGGGGAANASGGFPGASGTAGQGFAGGSGIFTNAGFWFAGGGGGGAGSAGADAIAVSYAIGGNGGSGVLSSINGTPTYYGGGGGGGGYAPYSDLAGSGIHGGGNGGYTASQNGFAGTEGLGGGGGGAAGGGGNSGGKGGRGVVIISYPLSASLNEVNVIKSEDSATTNVYGKTTIGDTYSDVHINGGSISFDINGTAKATIGASGITSNGNILYPTSGTAPITVSNGLISIPSGSASQNGYISSGDWTTFNNKQASGTYNTTITSSGAGTSLVNTGGPAVTQILNSISGVGAVNITGPTNGVIFISGNTTAYQPAGNYVVSGSSIVYNQLTASGTNIRASGMTAGNRYEVHYNLITLGSAAIPYVRFNNDSTNGRYWWTDFGFTSLGAGSSAGSAVAQIQLSNTSQKVGEPVVGSFTITPHPANNNMVLMYGIQNGWENTNNVMHGQVLNGRYSGVANITEVDFVPSAGYYSGTVTVIAL